MENKEVLVELSSQLVDVLKGVLLNKLDFDNNGSEKESQIREICVRLEEAEKVFEKDMLADCDIKFSDAELGVVIESLQRQIEIEKSDDIKKYFEYLSNLFIKSKETGEKIKGDFDYFESSEEKATELLMTMNYEDVTLLGKVLRGVLDKADKDDKDYELLVSWYDNFLSAGMVLSPKMPNEEESE